MSIVKLSITGVETDDELRQRVHQDQFCNGGYATQICRNCGAYWVDPDGDWRTAKIIDKCKHCFDFSPEKLQVIRGHDR